MNGKKLMARQRSISGPSNKEVRKEAVANPINPFVKINIDQPLISTIFT